MTAVGLDIGTSGVKGIALREDGHILARAHRGYPLLTPRPGWSEQDPEAWWQATEAVLDELRGAAGEPEGIGLSGQMHGLVLLDDRDRPLRPAILWNDQRTAAECALIEERIGFERLVELTGNRALTGFTAPKLVWVQRHEPEIHARIRRVMLPKDYVRLRLAGEHAGDLSDASGTLLLDVGRRSWSEPVCEALDVDPAWLPRLHESPEISGHAAGGVPVAAGAGDQAAGALGVGVDRPGAASVVLGTSGVVFAALEDYAPDPLARTHTFCHSVPGTWHAMGVMLSAAGSLEWARAALAPGTEFADLLTAAAAWAPGVEGLRFLPYLAGERTPHADPDARASFTGLSLRHDRGALIRAVLEGVAFALRDCADVVGQSTAGIPRALVSGGGARSELWLQILASVLEMPLTRTQADEGAAFGAALLGGVAAGMWPDVRAAVQASVTATETIEPVPDWIPIYAEARETFRALYPAIRDVTTARQPIAEERGT